MPIHQTFIRLSKTSTPDLDSLYYATAQNVVDSLVQHLSPSIQVTVVFEVQVIDLWSV
jgi:hypothetical protein